MNRQFNGGAAVVEGERPDAATVVRPELGRAQGFTGCNRFNGRYTLDAGKAYGPAKPIWHYEAKNRTDFFSPEISGAQRLPNGNTVIANWLGHGQFGKAPHVIEITPDKRVVWSYANHEKMRTISSVQLLDVPGDVTRGEILH